MTFMTRRPTYLFIILATIGLCTSCVSRLEKGPTKASIPSFERVGVSDDRAGFVLKDSGRDWKAWGFNYDHDEQSRLIEEYWEEEWATVVEDFREMKSMGANTVRIHLQFVRFMDSPGQSNPKALRQLARLISLAEETGLYLDLTGLGCYRKADVPEWYDGLSEEERWAAQATFWEAIAKTCGKSNAIFCYDLMNEPIIGGKSGEEDWLAGEFGGFYFVQRIALHLNGRSREAIAKAWINKMVAAIRQHDSDALVTVGVIPWAHTWPKAKPLFYAPKVGENLDFVSVHFYPEKNGAQKALTALAVYDVGKPLVIEEMFPLKCGLEQMDVFLDGSRDFVDGWLSFYWGRTIEELDTEEDLASGIKKAWLEYLVEKRTTLMDGP